MYEEELLKWGDCPHLDNHMKNMLESATVDELKAMMAGTIEFGTGGMRGIIGPGSNQINQLTIARASYGFGKYLKKKYLNKTILIVIGYDNRHYSEIFARLSGEILSALGINVKLFSRLTATPIVSYGIREMEAQGGIMITASHNPPQYNGFKIYDETGCQFLPDEIDKVVSEIELAKERFTFMTDDANITILDEKIENRYVEQFENYAESKIKNLKIGYSGQHGTGSVPVRKVFAKYGFENVCYALNQEISDPNFTNTRNPNPEDPAAFEELLKLGQKYKLDLLLTTDPDADRMGAFYLDKQEKYQRLSGNQIGAIFAKFLIETQKNLSQKYLVKTIVTSDLGAKIAASMGVKIVDVLTGFKYIGNQINIEGSENFLLGYEESFGYLYNPLTRDKDGLQSVLLLSEIANRLKEVDLTLGDYLETIYTEFGYYSEDLITINLTSMCSKEKVAHIIEIFEKELTRKATKIEDYGISLAYDVLTDSLKAINLPKERVIKFHYEDGAWICIRPSGTEPKLKVYIGTVSTTSNQALDRLKELRKMVNELFEKVE